MYKLIKSSKRSDDLSIGFDRSRNRRKDELALNRNVKGKCHLKILFKDVFGCADCQEKATYSLGYKLTLTRKKDDVVIDKTNAIADARIRIDHIHWCVPHYTLSIQKQNTLSRQILSKTPTDLRYVQRFFYATSEQSKCMEF